VQQVKHPINLELGELMKNMALQINGKRVDTRGQQRLIDGIATF